MPLPRGHSKASVSKAISMLVKEGRPQKQAVAIALSNARRNNKTLRGAAEEFYNQSHAADSGKFTSARVVTIDKNDPRSIAQHVKSGGSKEAAKKKDTSNWHRDEIIKESLAKLHEKSSASTPKTSTPKASTGDKYKKNTPVKTTKGGGVPKPKYLKASAVEEFYNHNHGPDGKFSSGGGGSAPSTGRVKAMTTVGKGPSVASGTTRLHEPMTVKFKGGGQKANYATYRDAQGVQHQGGRFPKGGANAEGAGRMKVADKLYTKLGYHATARVVEMTKTPGGGGTIHPRTGHEPTKGYAVAQQGSDTGMQKSKAFDSKGNHTPAFEKMIRDKISELPKGKNDYLGTWHDPSNGRIEVNSTKVYTSRVEAIAAGRAGNQKSIYDIKNGKEIPTGGTGK